MTGKETLLPPLSEQWPAVDQNQDAVRLTAAPKSQISQRAQPNAVCKLSRSAKAVLTSALSSITGRAHLAKRKRVLRWQRDPEGMRLRILEAAKLEFSAHGIGGARVDRIAENAGANKRMLYYHVGNKEDLYLAVLEGAYEKIRAEDASSISSISIRPRRSKRLIDFTWNYFIRNPEFLALLNTENLAKAKNLKRSTKVKSMHSPFVEMIRDVVQRGVASGDFRAGVDPVQLYISSRALGFFYLSNSATLSVIFGRDLWARKQRTNGSSTWSRWCCAR